MKQKKTIRSLWTPTAGMLSGARRVTMLLVTLLLTLTAQSAWADGLTGSGTETEPYLITSTADWDLFCSWMNAETNTGSHYKLTGDISVTTMSGGSIVNNRLSGTFDGDGHTITVNYGSAETPLNSDYAAPFRYIRNATIKNLHVTGHIYTSAREAAGLVGNIWTNGSVNISTCWSSVVIHGTSTGLSRYAGFISYFGGNNERTVTITDCLFDGQLLGNGNSTYCGGFVGGNGEKKKLVFNNCLFAPSAPVTVGTESNYTFWYTGDGGTATLTNCYYKTSFGTAQGTNASEMTDEALVTALGSMWEVKDSKIILRMADFGTRMDFATVDGIQPAYKYTGNTIDISAYSVKNYYGTALNKDVDYSVTLKRNGVVASEVKEKGLYSLELTGVSPYIEKKVVRFLVASYPDALTVDPDCKYGDAGILYINMPVSGSGSIDFTGYSSDLTFKIYDDGGKSNDYSAGWNSVFTVKAPAGYAVKLTGIVDALKTSDASYLTVYNGTETTEANRIGNEKYGTHSLSGGGAEDIGTLVSGQTMTLKFTSNSQTSFPGLNLTVTFVPSLSEADGITTAIAAEIAGKQVNFTRSFANGVASTVCLPFPMTGLAENTVYEMTSMDKTGEDWVATMTNVTSTDAGKPYLVKTQADGAVQFSGTVPNDFDGTAGTSSATYNGDGSWTFRGTYTTLTYGTNLTGAVYGFAGAAYGLNSVKAGDFVKAETGAYVSPFRCYLTYNAPSSARPLKRSADIELPSRIVVRLVGSNGQTTAIGSMDTRTGKVTFGDAWYTLDGRRIEGQPTQKGVYIQDGKKIIVK